MAERLGLFLTSNANDYLRAIADEARITARRLGLELEVSFADNNSVLQIQQLYACVHREPDRRPRALLVMPVEDEALTRVASKAVSLGVGWIALFRRMDHVQRLRVEAPGVPVAVVSPDQAEIGAIQAAQIRAQLPAGGVVLYVHGTTGNSSTQERMDAALDGLVGSRIEIGGRVDGRWSAAEAEKGLPRALRLALVRHSAVNVVACQNDAMARGAIQALRTLAREDARPELARIPVLGADGLPDVGQAMVRSGELAATIVLPMVAGRAVELAVRALTTGAAPPAELLLSSTPYPDIPWRHRLG
jgi:ABC-type sugar transport system substrate-binding protein